MNYLEMLRALKKGENSFKGIVTPEKLEQIRTHSFYKPHLKELAQKVEAFHAREIPTIRYSLFKLFDENGSRVEFQEVYMQRREMLIAFTLDALINGGSVSDLEDILWATCDEYSWCLTAHFGYGGTAIPEALNAKPDGSGYITGHFREQSQVIDLCNATTAAALAEVVWLLEDRLAPAVVYRVRKEIQKRIFEPFMSVNTPFFWEYSPFNWAAVCAGNIGMAAIYMIKDSEVLAPVLMRCSEIMDCYLTGFQSDGVCAEGIGYWNYGFGNYVMFADLVRRRTDGAIDWFKDEKIHSIARFQQNVLLNGSNCISFSDASPEFHLPVMITYYLNHEYDDVIVPDVGEEIRMLDNREYVTLVLRTFLWTDPDVVPSCAPEGDIAFEDNMWFVSRATAAKNGVKAAFAVKGGNNEEPHNHNDVGSFIMDIDGDVFVCDSGSPIYNKAYFSDKRYDFLAAGSQGHSVPIIDGQTQRAGAAYCATNFCHSQADNVSCVSMDIAPAYAEGVAGKAARSFRFDKDTASLYLEDCFEGANSVVERFTSRLPAEIRNGELFLRGEKHTVKVTGENAVFTEMFTEQLRPDSKPVYFIDAKVDNADRPVRFAFEII